MATNKRSQCTEFKTSRKVLKVAQWKDANGSWKLDVSNSFVLGQTMYDDWLMTDWWTDGGEGSDDTYWRLDWCYSSNSGY